MTDALDALGQRLDRTAERRQALGQPFVTRDAWGRIFTRALASYTDGDAAPSPFTIEDALAAAMQPAPAEQAEREEAELLTPAARAIIAAESLRWPGLETAWALQPTGAGQWDRPRLVCRGRPEQVRLPGNALGIGYLSLHTHPTTGPLVPSVQDLDGAVVLAGYQPSAAVAICSPDASRLNLFWPACPPLETAPLFPPPKVFSFGRLDMLWFPRVSHSTKR
jgi:hypothetical protein